MENPFDRSPAGKMRAGVLGAGITQDYELNLTATGMYSLTVQSIINGRFSELVTTVPIRVRNAP